MVNILQFIACLQNPRVQGEGLGAPDPPAQHLQGLQAQGGAHAGGSLGLSRQVGHQGQGNTAWVICTVNVDSVTFDYVLLIKYQSMSFLGI